MKTPRPPIPENILRDVYAEAAVPVNRLTPHSATIWEAVTNYKAAQRHKHGVETAWRALRAAIDSAIVAGHGGAVDEMANATARAEVKAVRKWTIRQEGQPEHQATQGKLTNPPRRAKTLAIITAIFELQQEEGSRAPMRREILDYVSRMMPEGLDESELSRQLTRLGWKDLLS